MFRGIWRWMWWGGVAKPVNILDFKSLIRRRLQFQSKIQTAISLRAYIRRVIDLTREVVIMHPDPRVGDTGTKILLQVLDETGAVVDISSAVISIVIKESRGPDKVFSGVLDSDGADGRVYCLTLSGTFDVAGNWQAQVVVAIGANTFRSKPVSFSVGANL